MVRIPYWSRDLETSNIILESPNMEHGFIYRSSLLLRHRISALPSLAITLFHDAFNFVATSFDVSPLVMLFQLSTP